MSTTPYKPPALIFDESRMRLLDPGSVRFVFVHTQGSPGDTDSSAKSIHDYHLSLGWAGLGYHFVIRKDGSLEMGRSLRYQGAQVEGLNHASVGICCSGHGNLSGFTPAQYATLALVSGALLVQFELPIGHLLGHREVNQIPGVPRTTKPCPGSKVSVDKIRKLALLHILDYPEPHIVRRDLKIPPLPHPQPFV